MRKNTKQAASPRNLWEMTLEEFGHAAEAGKLVAATGKKVRGENKGRTPLRIGELNKYTHEDIAHFYFRLAGGGNFGAEVGYQYLLQDALTEGRTVPSQNLAKYPKIFRKAKKLGLVRDERIRSEPRNRRK
jgi:hypothetical protein